MAGGQAGSGGVARVCLRCQRSCSVLGLVSPRLCPTGLPCACLLKGHGLRRPLVPSSSGAPLPAGHHLGLCKTVPGRSVPAPGPRPGPAGPCAASPPALLAAWLGPAPSGPAGSLTHSGDSGLTHLLLPGSDAAGVREGRGWRPLGALALPPSEPASRPHNLSPVKSRGARFGLSLAAERTFLGAFFQNVVVVSIFVPIFLDELSPEVRPGL